MIFFPNLTEIVSPKMAEPSSTPSPVAPVIIQKSPSKSSKLDVDNFVPETDAIENFLDDEPTTADRLAVLNINEEDTDDEDTPNHDNPMVASFAEDVEIDDYDPGQQETVNLTFSKNQFISFLMLPNNMGIGCARLNYMAKLPRSKHAETTVAAVKKKAEKKLQFQNSKN